MTCAEVRANTTINQSSDSSTLYQVMLDTVQSHSAEVVVIDEIRDAKEVEAAKTTKNQGVVLLASAHSTSLRELVHNRRCVCLSVRVRLPSRPPGPASARKTLLRLLHLFAKLPLCAWREESPALKRRKTSSKRTQDNMNADEDLRKLSRLLSDRMDYDEGSGDDAIASPCVVVQWLRNRRCQMIAGVTTGCWLLAAGLVVAPHGSALAR